MNNKKFQYLLYKSANEEVKVNAIIKDETIWLTQKAMAELFGVNVPSVSRHLSNIYGEGELQQEGTVSKIEIVQQEGARKPIPKYKPAEDCDSYNFAVAGVYYHQDEIIEGLMEENPEYELTKKEIKEDGLEDTFLYKYGIAFTSAELVPEPENPHDPNAIKVIADGVFVGHVPAKETKAVRKIMDEKKIIKTECQIYGGDYKVLDYDSSSIRKGSTNLKAVVSI